MADVIAFRKRKIRTNAYVLDYNKDGILTKEDFELYSDRYMTLGKVTEDKGRRVRALFRKFWDDMLSELDVVQPITYDVYAEAVMKRDKDQLSELVSSIAHLFFDVMDMNDDGMIDLSEFTGFFAIIGRDEEMAIKTFRAIDTNNDQLLSRDEYLAAVVEFFVGEDQTSPYQFFCGDLI